ncbi:hypothetical protein TWF718_002029 [Orbilia javanica]|uniref:MYND-type domain-containing protein n=1 Tax=Orbilia javanica TaxID=47235 RepID=A0AAN8RHU8_9PEZI
MDSPKSCATCKAGPEGLKNCARCKSVYYCSRDCQKAHWKQHKKVCGKSNPTPSPTGTASLDKPFHLLDAEKWLHNRSETDTFGLLIDTYRLRAEDNYNLEGNVSADNVLGGAKDSSQGFHRFLSLVEAKPHLLPAWWTPEKSQECVKYGLDTGGWYSLKNAPEKGDIIEHYGESTMPMQLRMFGEQVYGTGPGGQPGAMMRKMMMSVEAGQGHGSVFGL